VCLNDVVRDAVEIARPKWEAESKAQGKQVELAMNLREIPDVSGNVYELTQVVSNLIFNAVEAMPEGGRIAITTTSDGGRVTMRVADTGTGMDEETRKRLFEPFFTTKETGQGLGTSIVFGIVSRHHGEVSVDSELGKGTVFTVTFPVLGDRRTEQAPEPAETHRSFAEARILLVDDDDLVRETHGEVLKAGGHHVVPVRSGAEAVELCGSAEFDLVITDMSMPGLSGLDLATRLKRIDAGLPVVLLSGWAVQELEEKVREAGIDHILVKPCLMEDLLDVVQKAARAPIAS